MHKQPEVGEEAYDKGPQVLTAFFHRELQDLLHPDLHPKGRTIIDCCLLCGTHEEYAALIPHELMRAAD